MNFVQTQIDKGFTKIIITNRGEKVGHPMNRVWSPMWETFVYHIETPEDLERIRNLPIHKNHPQGISVGYAKP